MAEENPYAPPSVSVLEAPSELAWKIDGLGLLVKNKTVLPEIDLETGEQTKGMLRVKRIRQKPNWLRANLFMICIFSQSFLNEAFGNWFPSVSFSDYFGSIILVMLALVSSVVSAIQKYRNVDHGHVVISEYISIRRRNIRRAEHVTCACVLAAPLAIALYFLWVPSAVSVIGDFGVSTVVGLFALLILPLGIFAWLKRTYSNAKTHEGPPGWMKIEPIHPDALAYFLLEEGTQRIT
jgi:hypothetical protein